MKNSVLSAFGGMIAMVGTLTVTSGDAAAITVQECSAKYKAAKETGSLGDKTWNDFRKSECGDGTAAAAPVADANTAASSEVAKLAPPAPTGAAVFPSVVSAKYASERAAKARMHTCLDQYKSNKTANANGGLKWIMKGGGYYSECNKRLKAVKA